MSEEIKKEETEAVEEKKEKLFTQKELNNMITERLERDRQVRKKEFIENIEEFIPDETKQLIEEAKNLQEAKLSAEEEDKKRRGEFESLIMKKDTEHKEAMEAILKDLQTEKDRALQDSATRVFQDAYKKLGGNPGATEDAVDLMVRNSGYRFTFDEARNVQVVNDKNEPVYDDENLMERVTPEKIVSRFLDKKPHFRKDIQGSDMPGNTHILGSEEVRRKTLSDVKSATTMKEAMEVMKLKR